MKILYVIAITLWIVTGIMNFISCRKGFKCEWIQYWLVYTNLIVSLVCCLTTV